ncbi:MAG: HD domain-containing protein [Candidatus Bathyarchaeota archaeon]|nr:HD domain-containing protein [Candidatus Bathyarchaeota archaeon]
MDLDKLWQLATPYLSKNDFGVAHTRRVFEIAKQNFPVKAQLEELTFASIILHDIGGSSIKDQYEKGPQISAEILKQIGSPDEFIMEVCAIVGTHHEHPACPSEAFRVLYDSDKLVMFSQEEYPHYNAREGFDWDKIVALIYSEQGQELARLSLRQRRKETMLGT